MLIFVTPNMYRTHMIRQLEVTMGGGGGGGGGGYMQCRHL